MLPQFEPFGSSESDEVAAPPVSADSLRDGELLRSDEESLAEDDFSHRDDRRSQPPAGYAGRVPMRQTRSHLMQLFGAEKLHPRHDLGQNFLIDLNLLELIVQTAELTAADVVLEVGAGTGGLTTFLADAACHVVSVEYDPNMYRLASENLVDFDNVTLLQTDALKNKHHFADVVTAAVDEQLSSRPNTRLKLVANLPYHIGTPVMANLIASDWPWERMVVTIQYELAERMCAAAGSEHYSALSVFMQAQCQLSVIRKLGPTVFWPRPKVDSAILFVQRDLEAAAEIHDRAFFHEFVRDVFSQRRKLLRSVLVHQLRDKLGKPQIDDVLASLNLGGSVRAEELPVATFVTMSNAFASRLHEEKG